MNTIQVDRHNGVVEVTLDRPAKKNAMNGEMIDELRVAFAEIAESTPDDRVVVITGSGGAFCSGADLTGRTPGVPPLVAEGNAAPDRPGPHSSSPPAGARPECAR